MLAPPGQALLEGGNGELVAGLRVFQAPLARAIVKWMHHMPSNNSIPLAS